MFLTNSRYAAVATITVRTRDGREVTAVKLRRLPTTPGSSYTVVAVDRLDIVARRRYEDATRFWHVADANTELEARALEASGRVIEVPET
jgi:hypothetical protein